MNEQKTPEQLASAIIGLLREAQKLTAQLRAQRRQPAKSTTWNFGTSVDHSAPLASHIQEAIAGLQSLFGGRL